MSVSRLGLLRDRGDARAAHVTSMELFFDLVYVFAFTQLSEHLYEHLSWSGAAQTAVIFAALWWSWNYTAWATGWIDPERHAVAALLAVLMVASLVMATSITRAFAERGEAFAIAYVTMQLLRSGFMVWTFGPRETMGRNYAQLLGWSVLSGAVWIVGGLIHDHDTRLLVWALAAAVDLAAPLFGFRLPGTAATPMEDWTLAGGHLAERCQLMLMIAFGESFLRIGESFTRSRHDVAADSAFMLGFLLTLALWAVYFLHHAEPSAETVSTADADAARLARSAYGYAHPALVGAVIVIAVATHFTIEAPREHVTAGFAGICVGGPALFMLGIALSKRWLGHGRVMPPLLGMVALCVLGAATGFGSRIVELIAVTLVSGLLSVWALREPGQSPGG